MVGDYVMTEHDCRQVAGKAAAQALAENVAVQDVDYGTLRSRLMEDGQVLGVSE